MECHSPSLLDHFYAQLRNHPSLVAVEDGTQSTNRKAWRRITYAQLDMLSEVWSERMRLAGIGVGSIVPLLSTRSIAMVAATLAILKLRAAYVPIDFSSWGKDRIESVLQTVDSRVIVSTSGPPSVSYPCSVIELDSTEVGDTQANGFAASKKEYRDLTDRSDDLAYIIFTSGTTGKPKGVMVGQRSISRYVKEGGELPFNLNVKQGTQVLLICSIAFDGMLGVIDF